MARRKEKKSPEKPKDPTQTHLQPLTEEQRDRMLRDLYVGEGKVGDMKATEKVRRSKAITAIRAKEKGLHNTARRLREDDRQKGI